jgi:hypothetical protein
MTIDRPRRQVDRVRVSNDAVASLGTPLADTLDLIYRMWMTWSWARTGQFTVLLLGFGLVIAVILGGLGLAAHNLGAAAGYSVASGLLGGGGAHWLVNRRRRARARPQRRTPGD